MLSSSEQLKDNRQQTIHFTTQTYSEHSGGRAQSQNATQTQLSLNFSLGQLLLSEPHSHIMGASEVDPAELRSHCAGVTWVMTRRHLGSAFT